MEDRRKIQLMLVWYDIRLHRGMLDYAGEHDWYAYYGLVRRDSIESRTRRPDGIICTMEHQYEVIREQAQSGIPVVEVSVNHPQIKIPRVVPDFKKAGVLAAEHYLRRGYRHLYTLGRGDSISNDMMRRAFDERLGREGAEPVSLDDPLLGLLQEAAMDEISEFMHSLNHPAGLFVFHDRMGHNMIEICLSVGLRVPQDVAVLSVDNKELMCDYSAVPLSSVDTNLYRVGYEAAAL